ncbi:MAG: hypothetical protein HYX26_09310 [Acidobacteriales bacterium]|nr:hypothetical protein [Terriglobales bacterium]
MAGRFIGRSMVVMSSPGSRSRCAITLILFFVSLSSAASADSVAFTSGFMQWPLTGYTGTFTNANGDTADIQAFDAFAFIAFPDEQIPGQTYPVNPMFWESILEFNGELYHANADGSSCNWSYTPGTEPGTVTEPFECVGQLTYYRCVQFCDSSPIVWEIDALNPLIVTLDLHGTVTYEFGNGSRTTDLFVTFTDQPPTTGGGGQVPVPEPATFLLVGSGLPLLLHRLRSRR